MIYINVLTSGAESPNGVAFIFPLVAWKNHLLESGITVNMYYNENSGTMLDCDFLFIDSKYLKRQFSESKESVIDKIVAFGTKTKVLFFDNSDSAGFILNEIVPHVSKYLKSSAALDKNIYKVPIYGRRLHSNYYHKKYGIIDKNPDVSTGLSMNDINKIGVSWNSGMRDHSLLSPVKIKAYSATKYSRLLQPVFHKRKLIDNRNIDCSVRYGATYSKSTLRFQRELMTEKMKCYVDNTTKLNRIKYFNEIQNSKLILSPFGLGEITLKDFEVFITGGVLMKPSMDSIDTWPPFYQDNITYLSINWDLDNIENIVNTHLEKSDFLQYIADEANSVYFKYTKSYDAPMLFENRLKEIVKDCD